MNTVPNKVKISEALSRLNGKATLEDNSSDSDRFKGKEDLFFIAFNKGDGIWGLREYK